MAEELDVQAMIIRFGERAAAVRRRSLPPVEGAERRRFMEQAQLDYMDFAIIADAEGSIEEGVLTLRVDLRPRDAEGRAGEGAAGEGGAGEAGLADEPDGQVNGARGGRPHHTPAGELGEHTAQTPGMRRFEGISGRLGGAATIWMGETHVAPGTVSAVHHHGRSETAIFVLKGRPSFVFASAGGEERFETGPGDYVYVPPFVAHREENATADDAVVVIARNTEEAIVVNLAEWPDAGAGGNQQPSDL